MKAYSLDLHQRIVATVEGGQSKAAVARRFVVSYATVGRYLTSWRRTRAFWAWSWRRC